MKATINGIQVEGTPEEINELISMQSNTVTFSPNLGGYCGSCLRNPCQCSIGVSIAPEPNGTGETIIDFRTI